jgi:hypothetical protein
MLEPVNGQDRALEGNLSPIEQPNYSEPNKANQDKSDTYKNEVPEKAGYDFSI